MRKKLLTCQHLIRRVLYYSVKAGIIAFEIAGIAMMFSMAYYFICLAGQLM